VIGGEKYEDRGLVPRALSEVFQSYGDGWRVWVSFVEVYNDEVYDLLDPRRRGRRMADGGECVPLRIKEDRGVDANVYEVGGEEEALQLLFMGAYNRVRGTTGMNDESSRSHAVFRVTIERLLDGGVHTA
jgi:hypothetical protein